MFEGLKVLQCYSVGSVGGERGGLFVCAHLPKPIYCNAFYQKGVLLYKTILETLGT